MDVEKSFPEPSRIAIWLITLFGPGERGQAALGDLLEEFSNQRLKMGAHALRRWFWRQTLRTVVYLVVSELRSAPLTIAAAAFGGFFLRWFVSRSLNPMLTTAIGGLLHRFDLYARNPHAYIFWTIHLMYVSRFVVNFLVGVTVGMFLNKREMAGTMALALLGDILAIQAMLNATAQTGDNGYLWTLPWSFAFSCAVVVGGATVRMRRVTHQF